MILSDLAIKRPVVACVINLLLIVFGILAYQSLSVRQYPKVDKPTVSVRVNYSGASVDIMESKITKVIEDELSGILGVEFIKSSSRNGRSKIKIEFDSHQNIAVAANDVRSAVDSAKKRLPQTVKISVTKNDADSDGIISYAVTTNRLSPMGLGDYVVKKLVDPLSLVKGVSLVNVRGLRKKSLLVRIKPAAMNSLQITDSDIIKALRAENIEAPAGSVTNSVQTYSLRLQRSYNSVEDYRSLLIKKNKDGSMVYLSDVAHVYIGSVSDDTLFRLNGNNMVMLEFLKQSGTNTLDVINNIKKEVDQLKLSLPEGMSLSAFSDSSAFINSSIKEVYETLFMTALLVVLVIYIFLGSIRATLIPAVSVPVSLIGSFIVLALLGYSINVITLLAMVLAVGLLVDDAIVVLENIHKYLEQGEKPLVAAWKGTKEVGTAVIITTLVLVAAFMPIALTPGEIGQMFVEYAVALSTSVVISGIVALTMGPVLGSRFLHTNAEQGRFERWLEVGFQSITRLYKRALTFALRHLWLAFLSVICSFVFIWYVYQNIPQSFSSREDQGNMYVYIKVEQGSNLEALMPVVKSVEARMKPLTEKDGPIQSMGIRAPGWGPSSVLLLIDLKDWKDRSVTVFQLGDQIRKLLKPIKGVKVWPIVPTSFGSRSKRPVSVVIGGGSYKQLKKWIDTLEDQLKNDSILKDIESDYDETVPVMKININKDYAHQLGVSVSSIASTLTTFLSGRNVTTFIEDGQEYDVNIRAPKEDFNTIADIATIHIKSGNGELIRLDSLVNIFVEGQPDYLTHYNRRKSIALSANLEEGYTIGQGLDYINQVIKEKLPSQVTVDYKGQSLAYQRSHNSIAITFLLALLIVYLVLAAQFESFVQPLVIMMTVPLALSGAFFGMMLVGISLNVYSQIALIMLIGIATKNGILLVEFINQLRDRSYLFYDAIVEGSLMRLRPILMTAITTLVGSIPLIFATGAGSESRFQIGVVVFGGVFIATVMTLFVVPCFYQVIAKKTQSPKTMSRLLDKELKRPLGS